ncbi:hypothetical protein J4401_00870 [Candidatus Woesearchaeota archaeon]|nr:hypothetical protein [Candidatus Woesearchaeota archaeon]
MSADVLQTAKKDLANIGIVFIALCIIFKISFINEPLLSIARIAFSFLWMFVIPGISISYFFFMKSKFIVRFFLGFGIGAAVIGIESYYAGMLGLHIKYHGIILPVLTTIITWLLIFIKKPSDSSS